jgi:hypothetical protein
MFGVVVDGDMGGAGVLAGFLCHHPTARSIHTFAGRETPALRPADMI